jgi:hypothetical protein
MMPCTTRLNWYSNNGQDCVNGKKRDKHNLLIPLPKIYDSYLEQNGSLLVPSIPIMNRNLNASTQLLMQTDHRYD